MKGNGSASGVATAVERLKTDLARDRRKTAVMLGLLVVGLAIWVPRAFRPKPASAASPAAVSTSPAAASPAVAPAAALAARPLAVRRSPAPAGSAPASAEVAALAEDFLKLLAVRHGADPVPPPAPRRDPFRGWEDQAEGSREAPATSASVPACAREAPPVAPRNPGTEAQAYVERLREQRALRATLVAAGAGGGERGGAALVDGRRVAVGEKVGPLVLIDVRPRAVLLRGPDGSHHTLEMP